MNRRKDHLLYVFDLTSRSGERKRTPNIIEIRKIRDELISFEIL